MIKKLHKATIKITSNIKDALEIQFNNGDKFQVVGQKLIFTGNCRTAFGKFRYVFNSKIPQNLRTRIFNKCVLPTQTYGSEIWTST